MIKRDGANVSIWQNEKEYHPLPPGVATSSYDVIIVGGGITGITTAWLLQKKGKKCVILEARSLCFGTTSGTTAHLNTLLDTPYTSIIRDFGLDNAKLVAQATSEAISFIESTIEELAIDCGFERTPAYLFSQNENQNKELGEIYQSCLDVGLNAQLVSFNPTGINADAVMEVKDQAKFHPVRYVQALAKDFETLGGTIMEGCRVTHVEEDDDVIKISTDVSKDFIEGAALIYATHIPPGVNLLHLKCAPFRSYAMAIKLADDAYPEGLSYDMYDPYHYYRTQDIDGERYLIAGGEDHKTGHEENTEEPLRRLEEYVRQHFDVSEIVYRWSSQYFEPVDGLPYIGLLPGFNKNVYVATGYSGNGMVFSSVAAHLISDLIFKRANPYQELFSSTRIKPVAGFPDFIKNNADVIKEFVGDMFSGEQLKALALPDSGEGKIFVINNKRLAISKDNSGQFHAINPLCTHMKCTINWNRTEQSWDCPCHGARYYPNGEVITGPASKDLELIELPAIIKQVTGKIPNTIER